MFLNLLKSFWQLSDSFENRTTLIVSLSGLKRINLYVVYFWITKKNHLSRFDPDSGYVYISAFSF